MKQGPVFLLVLIVGTCWAGCQFFNEPEPAGVQFGLNVKMAQDSTLAKLDLINNVGVFVVNLSIFEDVGQFLNSPNYEDFDMAYHHSSDQSSWELRKRILGNHFPLVAAKKRLFVNNTVRLEVPGVVGMNWIQVTFMDQDSITHYGDIFPIPLKDGIVDTILNVYPYYNY